MFFKTENWLEIELLTINLGCFYHRCKDFNVCFPLLQTHILAFNDVEYDGLSFANLNKTPNKNCKS